MIAIAIAGASLALAVAAIQTIAILRADPGTEHMRAIATTIRDGAREFLRREYTVIPIAALLLGVAAALALGFERQGLLLAGGFLMGAIGSGAAGVFGVVLSVRAAARAGAGRR